MKASPFSKGSIAPLVSSPFIASPSIKDGNCNSNYLLEDALRSRIADLESMCNEKDEAIINMKVEADKREALVAGRSQLQIFLWSSKSTRTPRYI